MSANRFGLEPLQDHTASGFGAAVAVPGASEVAVMLDVTAFSGTTPTLTVWLQGSRDGGATWFDLPHQGALTLNAAAAESGVTKSAAGNRNIIDGVVIAAALKAMARYIVFTDAVRPAYVISGTGPHITFQIDAVAKT